MDEKSTVLVVGAAGHFAGMVVPELVKRGVTVRALIRHPSEADKVRVHGASEIAVADLQDMKALSAAMAGVDRMFYIAPIFAKDEAEMGQNVVDVASRAGVQRFVFSSIIHPILSALVNHISKGPVEEAVLTSGMEYTFLHPALFFQNYAAAWPSVLKTGVVGEPYSADKHMTLVDYRDVAEVAAIALTEARLLHGTFELCAAGDLNRRDVAALMGRALGRAVEAQSPSFSDWALQVDTPYDADQMVSAKTMYDWYDLHELLGNSLTLRAILGREPRTLLNYFEELAMTSNHGGSG